MKGMRNSRFLEFILLIKEKTIGKNPEIFAASIAFAFVVSFSFIGLSRVEINGNSLMASVSNVANNTTVEQNFAANIVLRSVASHYELVAGDNMEKVDVIEGILALDPTRGVTLSSSEHILTDMGDGMYRFSIPFSNNSVKK